MKNLPKTAVEQLQQIEEMRAKAVQAGDTLNPAKAKRLASEVLNSAVDLTEQLVIQMGQLQMEVTSCSK